MGFAELLEKTQCIICGKPLGQESKDLGFTLCHEHRKCEYCDSDISPEDNRVCVSAAREFNKEVEVIHARCRVLRMKQTNSNGQDAMITISQSEYDFLNLCRLAIIPNPDLNSTSNGKVAERYGMELIQNMSFELIQKHVEMMEHLCAQNRLFLNKDPKVKKELAAIREQEGRSLAKLEASTSARPSVKINNEEVQLAHFMEIHDIKERTVGLDLMKKFNKSIKDLMEKVKLSEADAREMTTKAMKLNRMITK